jgi:O-methyltransferase
MRLDNIAVGVLRTLGLRNLVEQCLPFAPSPVRDWVRERQLHRQILNRQRLVIPSELKRKYREALMLLKENGVGPGDYLEFGVYNGSSLICMHQVMEELGVTGSRLIGFDSFEGLPPIAEFDSGGHWKPGDFKCGYEFTRRVLQHEGIAPERVTLIKGFYSDTLTDELRNRLQLKRTGIILIDCDLYQSTKEALAFCEPLIVDHTVILFDDWFPLADRNLGEKLAFDEFLAQHSHFQAQALFDFPPYGKAFLVSRAGHHPRLIREGDVRPESAADPLRHS